MCFCDPHSWGEVPSLHNNYSVQKQSWLSTRMPLRYTLIKAFSIIFSLNSYKDMHTFTAIYYCANGIPYINHTKVESDMSCTLEILTNRAWKFLTRITQTSTEGTLR